MKDLMNRVWNKSQISHSKINFKTENHCSLCCSVSLSFALSFWSVVWVWSLDLVDAFWLTQSTRETQSFGKDLFLCRLTQSISRELFPYFLFLGKDYFLGWPSQQERLSLLVKIYFSADRLSQFAENYFLISYLNLH